MAIGVVSVQHEEERDQDWQLCAARRLLHCGQARYDLFGHLRILRLVFTILQLKRFSGPAECPHHRAQDAG